MQQSPKSWEFQAFHERNVSAQAEVSLFRVVFNMQAAGELYRAAVVQSMLKLAQAEQTYYQVRLRALQSIAQVPSFFNLLRSDNNSASLPSDPVMFSWICSESRLSHARVIFQELLSTERESCPQQRQLSAAGLLSSKGRLHIGSSYL